MDINQAEIIKALRERGATVCVLSGVGMGIPDLIVGHRGKNYLMEIKNPKTKGKLTQRQIRWKEEWQGGAYHIVETAAEACFVIGAIPW